MKLFKGSIMLLISLITIVSLNLQPVSAESVAWYDGLLTKAGQGNPIDSDHTYSQPFNVTGVSSVTVKGYQYLPGSSTTANVKYQIVLRNAIWDEVLAETTVTGNYPKEGTWFSRVLTLNKPIIGSVSLKIINLNPINGVKVAGNVYK
ncbi:hypothetical protein NBRC13296_10605 [Paenibacillus chitinolyticus]|uniref:hypothetical protein n=1 Tax=Paenibacillus chitinolyticus TaxID=79263 RepID=UPI0035585F93